VRLIYTVKECALPLIAYSLPALYVAYVQYVLATCVGLYYSVFIKLEKCAIKV